MSTNERLATLEAKIDAIPDIEEDVKIIRMDVEHIKQSLQGQRGFVSGVVAVLSAVAAFVTAMIITAWEKIVGVLWP